MVIDRSDLFLKRMAVVVLDAEWSYTGNQMKPRTTNLSEDDTVKLLAYMQEANNNNPILKF